MITYFFPSYLYGSGIMEHSARWYIVGMAYTGLTLVCVMMWTLWITLSSTVNIKHRNRKTLLGILAIIVLYLLFDFFSGRYTEIVNSERVAQQVSNIITYTFDKDKNGNICIYENIEIR